MRLYLTKKDPHQRLSQETFVYSEWGFQPAVASIFECLFKCCTLGCF